MDWLLDTPLLEVVAAIAGLVWSALRVYSKLDEWTSEKTQRALLSLEAGVATIYESYVRDIKKARADGKLTKEEREEARRKAVNEGIRIGWMLGIDVAKTLGADLLPMFVDKIAQRRKEGNA